MLGLFKKKAKKETGISKPIDRPQMYITFELSVWYMPNGEVVLYLGNKSYGEIVAFRKEVLTFTRSDGNLPENFFDSYIENIKDNYRNKYTTPEDINPVYTEELKALEGNRNSAHNLIWNSNMFSVQESDYYRHRELFPHEWENCFEYKDYCFYIGEDIGMRLKNGDGTETVCEDGYFLVKAISLMDARIYYEEYICHNKNWVKDQCWEQNHEPLDCKYLIPAITEKGRERYPENTAQIEENHRRYGMYSDKKCFASVVVDKNLWLHGDIEIQI